MFAPGSTQRFFNKHPPILWIRTQNCNQFYKIPLTIDTPSPLVIRNLSLCMGKVPGVGGGGTTTAVRETVVAIPANIRDDMVTERKKGSSITSRSSAPATTRPHSVPFRLSFAALFSPCSFSRLWWRLETALVLFAEGLEGTVLTPQSLAFVRIPRTGPIDTNRHGQRKLRVSQTVDEHFQPPGGLFGVSAFREILEGSQDTAQECVPKSGRT